jgi:hypothetical protein
MQTIRYLWIILGIAVLAIPATAASVQPVVDFSANVTSGAVPLAVLFSDESSPSSGWAWFFGDETYTGPWTMVNESYSWASTAWAAPIVPFQRSIAGWQYPPDGGLGAC